MEFNCWSWKIVVCVVHKLLQALKQGQNKYRQVVSENTKSKDDVDNFLKWQLKFRS